MELNKPSSVKNVFVITDQKFQTTAYHMQCNGQVEQFHQILFRMIGKLTADKKAQWEQHLPELLQTYNSARSAMTGYSPHYLMFGRSPTSQSISIC